MAYQRPPRPFVAGNIDLSKRRPIKNPDGTRSLIRSMSIDTPRGTLLIPTISPRRKAQTPDEAIAEYRRTGKHLGIFTSREEADAASRNLSTELGRRRKRGRD